MAASRGVDNWNKNWKGQGNISTSVKVNSATIYEEDGSKSLAILTKGLPVTYLDNQSATHTRVAIQVGDIVYLTNIDNLQKPFLGNYAWETLLENIFFGTPLRENFFSGNRF